LWGPDAKEFKPERWLNEITVRKFQGHRHLLSFHDGPRICLGRSFALAEFKERCRFRFLNQPYHGGQSTVIRSPEGDCHPTASCTVICIKPATYPFKQVSGCSVATLQPRVLEVFV
ncbi:hypothetical protein B0H17DRAFT_924748, partial [Mycena rosella]